MNSSRTAILAGSMALAALFTGAGIANAQPADHLSDVGFVGASRCMGLAEGSHTDFEALKALLTREESRHPAYMQDHADEVRTDAKRQAARATGYSKQEIADELAGSCQKYLKG
jgi:hypothetical protein